MTWINSQQISLWGKRAEAKPNLPLLVARLIRATASKNTFLEFPRGADTYSGGWDGVVKCDKATAFVPAGISLWEMGTEAGVKGKADEDYEKRTKNSLDYNPAECVFVFVTPHKFSQKKKWVANKKAEGIWKDIVVYDGVNLEQWLSDSPAVGWWFSVFSGNMPPEGLLAAGQSWEEYAVSQKYRLEPQVLTCSRTRETEIVRQFLSSGPALMGVRARSRDEAVAFIIATAMDQDIQQREDFLSKSLVIDNATSFRAIANNRFGLVLIAKFEDVQPLNTAVTGGHHILVPLGADDSYGPGNTVVLPQLGRELEDALKLSGFSEKEARKYMVESGRDLTILRRLLKFPHNKIKWADPHYASLLLPALFLGRWDEKKQGDIAIIESLANEQYSTYIEKLNRWRNDPNPFVYQIGSYWRLTSPLDAWSLLADSITQHQLARFEEIINAVLGQVKPMFELEAEKRYMASIYGKESVYSKWVREGVSQSLILFALYGKALQIPVGDSQQWVNRVVSGLLSSRDPNLWRSLNDIMPLLAEAAPERFLSTVYASLFDNPNIVMGMFEEDPSPLFPRNYHTGLLWALEALAWFEPYLERVTWILVRLAADDPGGMVSNRPINSLREIYLAWMPQTFADRYKRNEILTSLAKRDVAIAWELLVKLLPESHGNARMSNKTRWREYGAENINQKVTWPELWESYSMILELSIPLAGTEEKRLAVLVSAAADMTSKDRNRLFTHLLSIAGDIRQEEFSIVAALRNTLHHHRQFPDADWALPESELAGYDHLLKDLEPRSTIEKYKFLFEESHPVFPEMNDLDPLDYQAEEKFICDKRIEGVNMIYAEFGFGKLLELAQTVREKRAFGDTLAFCLKEESEQLQVLKNCGLGSVENFNSAAGFTWRCVQLNGFEWIKRFYQEFEKSGFGYKTLAQFLNWAPLSSDLYQFLEGKEDEVVEEYWIGCDPWLSALSDQEKIGAVKHLLSVGRNATALYQLNHFLAVFSTKLIIRCVTGAALNPNGENRRPSNHEIGRVLKELYRRNDYDRDEMGKLEWLCLPLLAVVDRAPYTRILQEELVVRATFFVEMLELLYKPKGEGGQPELPKEEDQRKVAMAKCAYYLLEDWSRIPGTGEDGQVNDDVLNAWVDEARALATEKFRLEVADRHIGKLLAQYPRSQTGQWPPDAICSIIDRISTKEIRNGFHTGILNKQGPSSRGVFDGGSRERRIAANFQQIAEAILLKWPVTASIFESLVGFYLFDAVRHDEEAQKDSLDY